MISVHGILGSDRLIIKRTVQVLKCSMVAMFFFSATSGPTEFDVKASTIGQLVERDACALNDRGPFHHVRLQNFQELFG
jgi:hypothetical protein